MIQLGLIALLEKRKDKSFRVKTIDQFRIALEMGLIVRSDREGVTFTAGPRPDEMEAGVFYVGEVE